MQRILECPTPGEAKKRGRSVKIRPDWELIKRRMMLEVVLAKFAPGSQLAGLLVSTGDRVLVEGNTWGDAYWGAVPAEQGVILPAGSGQPPVWTMPDGRMLAGHNWLGRELMMVRDVIS